MDPLTVKTRPVKDYFMNWDELASRPYDKKRVDPYTKVRMILMNGTEFESTWFLHQFARHTDNMELKRMLAIVRSQEQQQQKRISSLKPLDENILETTISYEQLAIDLTAILARRETDENNIKALNFALLEDFDHLYRFANLLKTDYDIDADMPLCRGQREARDEYALRLAVFDARRRHHHRRGTADDELLYERRRVLSERTRQTPVC